MSLPERLAGHLVETRDYTKNALNSSILQDLVGGVYFHVSERSDMKIVSVSKLSDIRGQRKRTIISANINRALTVFIYSSVFIGVHIFEVWQICLTSPL